MHSTSENKGFTLIELLVVIAIVAILAVVVVLTLNPAELLKQARDSNRISDLNTLKSALSVYLSDVSSPDIDGTTSGRCYQSASTTNALAGCGFVNAYTPIVSSTLRNIDSTGWLPVNFTAISSGAPVGQLPIDPTNTNGLVYRYVGNTTSTFKLMATLESTKYGLLNSSTTAAGSDGGASSTAYETGTEMGM